jgi:hypothetical protein
LPSILFHSMYRKKFQFFFSIIGTHGNNPEMK